jgi:hypothetical protein
MTTVWDLIFAGRYEEARLAADEEFRQTSDLFPLRGKVTALLCLGRYCEAATLCEEIIGMSHYTISGDFISRGVSEWLDGREEAAIVAWRDGSRAQLDDAAGGVTIPLLLFFASIKRSDQALRKSSEAALRQRCKGRAIRNWPGPVARFITGDLDEAELIAAMSDPVALKERQSCQAEFYIGIVRLALGDQRGHVEFLARSCAHHPVSLLECEYFLAHAELKAVREREKGTAGS